jgi:hypothetical protein
MKKKSENNCDQHKSFKALMKESAINQYHLALI